MKRVNLNIISILLSVLILTAYGCKKEFVAPKDQNPTVSFESNTTVKGLREMFTGKPNGNDTLFIEDDIIIKGIVVANDESGNIYKKIVLQDETAGIDIVLDGSYMYNYYPVGQQLYIKCKGLIITDYGGQLQLGHPNGYLARIPMILIDNYLFKNGHPNAADMPAPIVINPANISNIGQYQSMLIEIQNCTFLTSDQGQEWCPSIYPATNRTIVTGSLANTSMVVRTSSYANFARLKVPEGTGTIYGILTVFIQSYGDGSVRSTTYQVLLRDAKDIGTFTKEE